MGFSDGFVLERAQGDFDTNAPTALISAGSTAESVALDAPVTGRTPRALGGKTTIYVQCTHSVASATVGIVVVLYGSASSTVGRAIAAPGPQTATAGTMRVSASGNYFSPALVFDAGGAAAYEVRISTATSSGTVDVYTWAV